MSSDKTVAIIDGSGVLHDPIGIDRTELVRLAKSRLPVGHFDTSKLSKDGYLVKVEQQDIKLPCESDQCRAGCTTNVLYLQLVKSSSMAPTSATRLT